MGKKFSQLLTEYRHRAKLSNTELAELSRVPRSLIGGLQSGKRVIGERQAKKIAGGLGLQDDELKEFILCAIDNCTEKVLKQYRGYPATLLNLLAQQLWNSGIRADQINQCLTRNNSVLLTLNNGSEINLETNLIFA